MFALYRAEAFEFDVPSTLGLLEASTMLAPGLIRQDHDAEGLALASSRNIELKPVISAGRLKKKEEHVRGDTPLALAG